MQTVQVKYNAVKAGEQLGVACLPVVTADSLGALIPGADFADVCTDKGSDLDGDIDLCCECAIVPTGSADVCTKVGSTALSTKRLMLSVLKSLHPQLSADIFYQRLQPAALTGFALKLHAPDRSVCQTGECKRYRSNRGYRCVHKRVSCHMDFASEYI